MAKKERFSRIKTLVRSKLDIKNRADTPTLKYYSKYVLDSFKRLFVIGSAQKTRNFNQALKEFKVTPEKLSDDEKALGRLVKLSLALAIASLIYVIYLLIQKSFHAAGFSMVLSGILFALAFRYHFWLFQIRKRKLGCTLKEWFQESFSRSST